MSDKSKSNTESRSDNSEYKEEKPVKNKGEKERENHYESENIFLILQLITSFLFIHSLQQ